MSREITSAAQGASQAEVARPVLLAELDFPSGFVRVNSSDRSIFFDSQGASPLNEFLGVGALGAISSIGETSGLQATGVRLSLSGIPPAHISAAFESAQGRTGKIWLGFLDDDYALTIEPILVFAGIIDDSTIDIGETATVSISVESRLIAWERAKIRRYTNEDQQQRFSGESPTITDKFLEFVNQTVDKELLWGIGGDGAPRKVVTSAPVPGEVVTFRGETFTVPADVGGGGDGGGGGGGGGCFAAGSPVLMADGSTKAVEDIEIGDMTAGGRVTGVMVFDGDGNAYDYLGVTVSGCHGVFEDGEWLRIRSSRIARKKPGWVDRWHVFDTTSHELVVAGVRFTDYSEVDPDNPVDRAFYQASLQYLNKQVEVRNVIGPRRVADQAAPPRVFGIVGVGS